ncbi:MAG: Gfo/Idh/MocA family oxidoreductase [Oscillospiraceae bacterium]|nr:Gfo/Idh/MocA family oxidoreductase [Oscillospiraceae bacterium]
MKTVKIGIVGCGAISGIYLENITNMFSEIEVLGVCDLIPERAENAAKKYGVPKLYKDMYELFADPEVDIVLNITRPYEHFDVSLAALKAGKNVYSEKPLAATLAEGRTLWALAREKGLMLGGAPDTFLGAGIQTSRKLIDDGFIGRPIGATAHMIGHGHETWHPDPEFYYKHGGGPLFDMGPYYLTALVNLLGNVSEVSAMTQTAFAQRRITSQPHFGEIIDVDVPTYVSGTMRFASGAIGTLFTTFDVYYDAGEKIEIYGTEGTLFVPDPNGFGGPVRLLRPEDGTVREIPLAFDYKQNSRALGLADMAHALLTGRRYRANSDMTLHVLEIMEGFITAGAEKRLVTIESRFEPTPQMARAGIHGLLDD